MGLFSSIAAMIRESQLARRRPLAEAEASARHLCGGLSARLGYRPTRLELHKLLFLSQIVLLGRDSQVSLIGDLTFRATDVGPICKPLDERLRAWHSTHEPIGTRVLESLEPVQLEPYQIAALNAVIDGLAAAQVKQRDLGGRLVAALYGDDGAYFAHYAHGHEMTISRESMIRQGRSLTQLRRAA